MKRATKRQKTEELLETKVEYQNRFTSIILTDNKFLKEELDKNGWALSRQKPQERYTLTVLNISFRIKCIPFENGTLPYFISRPDHQWLERIVNLLTWSRYYGISCLYGEKLLEIQTIDSGNFLDLYFIHREDTQFRRVIFHVAPNMLEPMHFGFGSKQNLPYFVLHCHQGHTFFQVSVNYNLLKGVPALPIQNLLYYLCIQFSLSSNISESLFNSNHDPIYKTPFAWNLFHDVSKPNNYLLEHPYDKRVE